MLLNYFLENAKDIDDCDSDFSECPGLMECFDSIDESDTLDTIPIYDVNSNFSFSKKICHYDIHDFKENIGPVHDLSVGSEESSYFGLFINDDFYDYVALETNKYAAYVTNKKKSKDIHWKDTTGPEIKAYIGVLLYMGIVKLPKMEEYFKDDYIKCPLVTKAFTLQRFLKIEQYLHVNDAEKEPKYGSENYDILYKIRPILKIIEKFADHYKPQREIAVDEAVIEFQGRCILKQYLRDKPHPWGLKAWCLCESDTGYLLNCNIYLGKKEERDKDLLLGEQVVMGLCRPYFGLFHHVYFDNFFSSIRLMQMLLDNKTYACGTMRSDRKFFPPDLKQKLKLQQGEFVRRQSGQITVNIWKDKKDVRIVSTNCSDEIGKVQRRVGKEKKEITCPLAVEKYNAHMNGVDLFDQKRLYYDISQHRKKWWKYIFIFVIQCALINSFILFDRTNRPHLKPKNVTLYNYQKSLSVQLVGNFSSRLHATLTPSLSYCEHKLIKIEKPRCCKMCINYERTTPAGLPIRTRFMCDMCAIPLCQ